MCQIAEKCRKFLFFSIRLKENDSNKIEATEKGSAEYDTEKEAADGGEKDSDSNNLSNHSSPNKAQIANEVNEKDELKLALDGSNEKDSDTEENTKQSIKPYVAFDNQILILHTKIFKYS